MILSVRDRVAQRAMADLLSPSIDPTLSDSCRAFRKGSSALSAADDIARWIQAGEPWVLRTDIQSFFDSIPQTPLSERLQPFVDEEGLRFLKRTLRCRIFDQNEFSEMVVGIAQGSPLSPLLANLYLTPLDEAIEREFTHYIRYCDDLIVLGTAEGQVQRAHEEIQRHLAELSLHLNQHKTEICRAEDGFVFLGYHFGPAGRGPAVKAIEALHCRLEEISNSEAPEVSEIDALFRGWSNYFGHLPECWTPFPAGILAILRQSKLPSSEEEWRPIVEARWRQDAPVSPALARELARAWAAAGREDQTWLEMALRLGGAQSTSAEMSEWSSIAGIETETLVSLMRGTVGSLEERRSALAEAAAELGRFKLADRLAQARDLIASTSAAVSTVSDQEDEADTALLLSFFQGREGVHAVESVNRSGHRSFIPAHRAILEGDWLSHLSGEKTLALPLVRAGDSCLIGVLDIDIERKALHERFGVPDQLLGRALGAALKLRSELKRRDCQSLLEFSGQKGYHLWMRLDSPAPCHLVRGWLLEAVNAAGPLPEGIRVEVFPDRDRVRSHPTGPLVKLPLGIHSKTGKRCELLDAEGPTRLPFRML